MNKRSNDIWLAGKHWLIRPEMLSALASAHEFCAMDNGKPQTRIDADSSTGDIKKIHIVGALMPYENWISDFFGWETYESIHRQLDTVSDGDRVQFIVDSPGGTVTGCANLAERIAALPNTKSVSVTGECCSAAYWLASGGGEISIEPTSIVGSIGVVSIMYRTEDGEIEITSSNAPNKRIDPETAEGKALVVEVLDEMERVMIERIAANRGTTPEGVIENYGAGWVKVGREAVASGMADKVVDYEYSTATATGAAATAEAAAVELAENTDKPEEEITMDEAAIRAEAQAAERERILAIQELAPRGYEAQAAELISTGATAEAAAMVFLRAQKQAEAAQAKNRTLDSAEAPVLAVAPAPDAISDEDAIKTAIAAAAEKGVFKNGN